MFKQDDFYPYEEMCIDFAVRKVNEKLNKLIESSPVVYRTHWSMENITRWEGKQFERSTYKARLMFIERIPSLPKEACKHEPNYSDGTGFYYCIKCGAKLQVTWTEAKS